MDSCKHEFTIESFNFPHHFEIATRRLNARGDYRAGTELVVQHDLNVCGCPHRRTIAA